MNHITPFERRQAAACYVPVFGLVISSMMRRESGLSSPYVKSHENTAGMLLMLLFAGVVTLLLVALFLALMLVLSTVAVSPGSSYDSSFADTVCRFFLGATAVVIGIYAAGTCVGLAVALRGGVITPPNVRMRMR